MDYDNPIKNDFLYGVYKLHIECEDYDLDGTFIAIKGLTEELLKSKKYLYLFEYEDGKYLWQGVLEPKHISLISLDQKLVTTMFNKDLLSGVNPYEYLTDTEIGSLAFNAGIWCKK